ncbi:hypothetical protein SGPA1_10186 [Streptomyces misionensis JCM 4497]
MLLAVLGGVGEQHHPAGGGDGGPLHGGLGEVWGGQSVRGGEAVGGDEQHVGADLAVRAQRPGVHGGPGTVPYPAADQVELEAGVVGEAGGDGQGVGDDGQLAVQRERGGQAGHGGAGVEDHGAVDGQFGQGRLGDAVLLVGRRGLAFGEVRFEVEAAGRDGPAVHPAQQSGPVEGLEVAADRLRRHLELLGERHDVHPAAVTGEPEDLLLPLRCVHVRLPPTDARICGLPGRLRLHCRKVNRFGCRSGTNGHRRGQPSMSRNDCATDAPPRPRDSMADKTTVPAGARRSTDIEYRPDRPTPYRARVRRTDPTGKRRQSDWPPRMIKGRFRMPPKPALILRLSPVGTTGFEPATP